MRARNYLLYVLVAFSLILMLGEAPISAQTPTDPQPTSSPELTAKGNATWQQLPLEIQAKVDPRILQELNGEVTPAHLGGRFDQVAVAPEAHEPIDKTRFIVYLKDQADLKAVSTRSFATAAEQRNAVVDTLIATAQQAQGPVKTLLSTRQAAGAVAGYSPFYIFNGLAVEGDLDTVIELAKRDDVAHIAANYPLVKFDTPRLDAAPAPAQSLGGLDPANWNIDLMDAERVWNELGINGAGAVVADFDTGVDWTHPALRPRYRGWNGSSANHNYNWFEFNAGNAANWDPNGNYGPSASTVPYDCDGHGTHTMGTMVGDGGTSTTHVGMAPGAKWIAAPGICGTTMPGSYGDSIGGIRTFQWLMCPTDLTGNLATRNCALAPDVINNSWGSSDPADDTFRPVIQALRAAGIVPVFAAGNPSAGSGSIGSPGSAPEGITVGATDINDLIAPFSGRGPSFYQGEQKPELSAPGVNINSTIPGGGYSGTTWSGTSMAAPAVSGLVALLISADLRDGQRDLNVTEIEQFMERTAVDLGPIGPDSDFGFGRIDAYNAVRWALSAGDLRGVVRNANTSAPIDGATISGVKAPDTFITPSGPNGTYSTTVPGGLYDVTVNAFGYNSGTFAGVSVLTGTNSIIDFNLSPQPTALLTGTVLSGTTPVNGALVYVDAKPSVSFTTGANGMYTLTLPVGAHALTVKATGYRVRHQNATVASGGSAQNISMIPAPTILLVEADAYRGWFYGRPAHHYFKWSLDQRDYLYDERSITSTSLLPTLAGYNVVIWIHTTASPGSGGFTTLLQSYLDNGGRLIISGQNIGSQDGSSTFYQNYLHATYLMDVAAALGDTVSGLNFLNGLNLAIDEAALYGYPNTASSLSPDAVTPRDGGAFPIVTYGNGNGVAALAVDACSPLYRAVYFAMGYENLGPRAYNRSPQYAEVLDRSIQWVIGSKPAYGVAVSIQPGSRIDQPGATVNYTLTLINTGINTDTYAVSLAGPVWPTQVLSGTTPVTQIAQLAPCTSQSLNVRVDIPAAAQVGASDLFTVTTTSQAAPAVTQQISARTTAFPLWKIETPMPTPRYRLGAAALPGTPYYFAMGGWDSSGLLAINERYNACSNTWTTMAPMPVATANVNAAVLNSNIYIVGGYDNIGPVKSTYVYNPALNSWSSMADLPVALSGVASAAANGKLYAFGGYDSTSIPTNTTYEYAPATGTWTTKAPMPGGARGYAAAAELGGKIYVVGGWANLDRVEVYDPVANAWSAAAPLNVGRQSPGLTAAPDGYLYVSGGGNGWSGLNSAERYNPAANTWTSIPSLNNSDRAGSASAYVAGRVFTVGGISNFINSINESLKLTDAFCLSTKQAQQTVVQPSERITYTVSLLSDPTTLANARVRDPIPAGTTFGGFGPRSVSQAPAFNSGQNRVEWTGAIPGGQTPVTFTFGVVVSSTGLVKYQTITNTATFSDGIGLNFDKTVFTMLDVDDLSPSIKMVDKATAAAGEVLTYTIHLANASRHNGPFLVTDPIPANTIYVPGSLAYTRGSASYANGTITWTGQSPSADEPYTWGDSTGGGTLPGVMYNWIDISATGTPLNLYDDGQANITLPFSFVFYGAASTALSVNNNGGVLFNAPDQSFVYVNQPLVTATIDNLIAPFWDDLDGTAGNVYYQLIGTAPNRIFVVEWYNRPHYSNIGSATFEMLLHEGSNLITFQYQDVDFGDAAYNYGASATVGLRQSGSKYIEYSYNSPVLTNGLAIRFAPPAVDLTFAVTTAAPLPPNTWITNTATITDSFQAVYRRSANTLINTVDLSASYKTADRTEAKLGDPVNYAIWLINTGTHTVTGASLSDPIPANTTWNGSTPTCTAGKCGYASGVITWMGDLAPGVPVVVSFGVTYTMPLPDLTPISNTATIRDSSGGALLRQAVFRARTPNLSAAYKTVDPLVAKPGQVVTYTVYLRNSGSIAGDARLLDPIPAGLTYVPSSLIIGSGSGGYAAGVITWTGNVPALSQIPVRFRTTVSASAIEGTIINNTATITDVARNIGYQRTAAFVVHRFFNWIYLPLIQRQP